MWRDVLLAVLGLIAIQSCAAAQEAPGQDDEAAAPAFLPAASEEVADTAFEQYINLDLLRDAWAQLDPAQLADAGLQLAEGERVLFRSHKLIDADSVLRAAVKLAAKKRDDGTLKRLAAAADALGKTELAGSAKTAIRLAAAPRAKAPAPKVKVDQISADTLIDYRDKLDAIETAELIGDKEWLKSLADDIKTEKWPDGLAARLSQSANQSLQAATAPDPDFAALRKLQMASRGKTFKLKNYSFITFYVRIYGNYSGFPQTRTITPGAHVPIPYPSTNMPVRVKPKGGSYTPKFTIRWQPGFIRFW